LFFGGLIQEIKTSRPSTPFTQQVQFNLQFKNDPQKQQKQQGAQIIITTTIVRSVLALIGVCDYVCTYVCLCASTKRQCKFALKQREYECEREGRVHERALWVDKRGTRVLSGGSLFIIFVYYY